MPDLACVVVAYRAGEDLPAAIDSARASEGLTTEVFVVNNDPADDGPRSLRRPKGLTVMEAGSNVGFCAAVNLGIARTTAPYVMLLNQDAAISSEYAARLVEHMERDASIAAAGGRIMRGGPDGRSIDSLGIEIQRGRRAVDIGHGQVDDGQRLGSVERFGVTAAAAIYRRSALEAVAVRGEILPESFFMYLDDVDLAWRLRLAGYRCVVDDGAVAWHRRDAAGDAVREVHGPRRILQTMAHEAARPDYVRERSWVNHLLMLIRNDEPDAFLAQFPYYAARRLPGDLFGLVQRPSMALRMRQRFLELLPDALAQRHDIQVRRVVSASEMARWLP